MLDANELEKVVELQARSYALLQWVRDQMDAGTLDVSTVASATAFYPVAHAWIGRNLGSLPAHARPAEGDIEPFTHLFVSFLTTSFALPAPGTVRPTLAGRYADWFKPASLLKARTPDKKAVASAAQMKDLTLTALAADVGIALAYEARVRLITDPATALDVSFVAYGRELIRRSQFASQGEGVLVLWREIAWAGGKPSKKFALTADRIREAQENLIARIRSLC